jgi:hypothetical protein
MTARSQARSLAWTISNASGSHACTEVELLTGNDAIGQGPASAEPQRSTVHRLLGAVTVDQVAALAPIDVGGGVAREGRPGNTVRVSGEVRTRSAGRRDADVRTVDAHLSSIEAVDEDVAFAPILDARRAFPLAVTAGANAERAHAVGEQMISANRADVAVARNVGCAIARPGRTLRTPRCWDARGAGGRPVAAIDGPVLGTIEKPSALEKKIAGAGGSGVRRAVARDAAVQASVHAVAPADACKTAGRKVAGPPMIQRRQQTFACRWPRRVPVGGPPVVVGVRPDAIADAPIEIGLWCGERSDAGQVARASRCQIGIEHGNRTLWCRTVERGARPTTDDQRGQCEEHRPHRPRCTKAVTAVAHGGHGSVGPSGSRSMQNVPDSESGAASGCVSAATVTA